MNRSFRRILVALDASEHSQAALDAAARKHQLRSSFKLSRGNVVAELVVLLCGADEDLVDLRARADKALNEDGFSAQFDDLRPQRIGLLSALLRRQDCGLLVIAHDNALIEARDDLLGELGLPVLLTK